MSPIAVARRAAQVGLTHVAITDHDVIDGALEARAKEVPDLVVIIGQEVRSTGGDMIAIFIEHPVRSGMSLEETAAAIHEQGGVVGAAHPFDPYRPSVGLGDERADRLAHLAGLFDFVEIHNGRARDPMVNARAADFARRFDVPGVAVSDAHRSDELGSTWTALAEAPADAAHFQALLRSQPRHVVRESVAPSRRSRLWRLGGIAGR